jgi:hypothetical protein
MAIIYISVKEFNGIRYRMLGLSVKHSSLGFGRSKVRIFVNKMAIQTEIIVVFPQSLLVNAATLPQILPRQLPSTCYNMYECDYRRGLDS